MAGFKSDCLQQFSIKLPNNQQKSSYDIQAYISEIRYEIKKELYSM